MENSMNKMIRRIRAVKRHMETSQEDLQAYYSQRLDTLKVIFDRLYGEGLKERLFDVYDEYCPDDEIKDVLEYVCLDPSRTSGVTVFAYDFPGVSSEITVKTSPLRIEISGLKDDFTEVLWVAAA